MAKVVFKQETGKHHALFPVNLFDKIPAEHPVRLVNQVVDSLDLSAVIKLYKGGGASAYHPGMLLKVLFYGYLSNVYSCRKLAKALRKHSFYVAFGQFYA